MFSYTGRGDLRHDPAIVQQLSLKGMSIIRVEEATRRAEEIGAVKYMECSALTQEGLKDVFDEAIRSVLNAPKKKNSHKGKCVCL